MLSPAEFLEFYTSAGMKKSTAPLSKLICLSLLAGILIGMGAVVSNTAGHALENASVARVVCGLLFPFGLVLVIYTGAELFTGNCLITISVMRGSTTWQNMLRNLVIVYFGNFAGALLLAVAIVYGGQLNLSGGMLALHTIRTAAAKCSLPFGQAVILGILCNLLVCIGVMCALSAKSGPGRAIGAFLPVSFFVIGGFEHCVANMYYIPAGLLARNIPQYYHLAETLDINLDALTWGTFLLNNLLPVTIGNLLGGCGFAALICLAHGRDIPSRMHSMSS